MEGSITAGAGGVMSPFNVHAFQVKLVSQWLQGNSNGRPTAADIVFCCLLMCMIMQFLCMKL